MWDSAERGDAFYEPKTPCDIKGDDGQYHCPYADTYTGYEGEMCRVMCGLGVDE